MTTEMITEILQTINNNTIEVDYLTEEVLKKLDNDTLEEIDFLITKYINLCDSHCEIQDYIDWCDLIDIVSQKVGEEEAETYEVEEDIPEHILEDIIEIEQEQVLNDIYDLVEQHI